MPPKRLIGARKKIARTTRAATRRTAASKAAAETVADETDAEITLEETATETLPGETASQNTTDGVPAVVETIAEDTVADTEEAIAGSSMPESCSVSAIEAQSGDPMPEIERAGKANGSAIAETSAAAEINTKSSATRTTKRLVRKVTRKVPVRVMKNKAASVVTEENKESVEPKPVLAASTEGNEEANGTEANISEPVKEESLNPKSESQGPESASNSLAEEPSPAAPLKKVRKIKRVVLVKKLVKKPKIAPEKPEETGGTDAKPKEVKLESDSNEESKGEITGTSGGDAGDELIGMSESQKRRKTEIFVGGLDKNAKEEDLRKVFGKAGEIVEVRMMMDGKTGKNKGYAFVRYATSAQAKQAVTEFSKVEVCGKQCGAAALQGNDTLFLGNIDKKWKKDDITKILKDLGIEKMDSLTLMADPMDSNCNRGFAFLDFETNKDAQIALKRLQKKDAFGKGHIVKVAWAEPFNNPDEEEMQKVKAVFAEGIPLSWDENQVTELFSKYGKIESVVLSRNMVTAKRKDFAFVNFTTREDALSCIESFENVPQVNLKVSLAKPMQKSRKRISERESFKGRSTAFEHKFSSQSGDRKVNASIKGQTSKSFHANIREAKGFHPRVHREQSNWKQMDYSRGPVVPDHGFSPPGGKRPFSSLGEDSAFYSDSRSYTRSRMDIPSYRSYPQNMGGGDPQDYYRPSSYHQYEMGPGYGGASDISFQFQPHGRTGNAPPYRTGPYTR